MRIIKWSGLAVLAVAGLLAQCQLANASNTPQPMQDGRLIVEGDAPMFSQQGITSAKSEFAQLKSQESRQVLIHTLAALPAADKETLGKIDKKDDAALRRFWIDFAKVHAKEDGARGIYILISKSPGQVVVLADTVMRDGGFSKAKEDVVREKLAKAFREAKDKADAEATAIRDGALLDVAKYLRAEVPAQTVNNNPASVAASAKKKEEDKKKDESSKIGSYICIGLCVLLGVWLVIGLIRAFSNRGGGGGTGGGGGGGGGFMSGLLGGLFGAMAGMWLYNSVFGGHDTSAFGGDSSGYGGDNSGGGGETGGGDFGGDSGSAGGYDGDAGGGGGDWGGGGDAGGGGGDW